ncbi:MAG: phosphoribosylaminoimidazolesuccinocarboxamide synthase [Rhodothermales bacterium]
MTSTDILEQHLDRTIDATDFDEFGKRYRGKVRDTYRREDVLILVTTDRISAFDHVLRQQIPFKGQVLNQTAAYFLEKSRDIAPNHLIAVPDPNVTVAVRCEPVPVEFVVRGYLAGHAWREYRDGRRQVSGVALPGGLKESSRLPAPILTPATKADEGHDEDISGEEIVERGILSRDEFDELESISLRLFDRGTRMSAERGLLLVDTKYEFGRRSDGAFVVIDEVHTPDSSRFYYADGYEERLRNDEPQQQLSKEFVREWLMDHDFQGKEGQTLPDLPDSFRVEVARRYVELYEAVTGREFVPETHPDPKQRIREALSDYFGT